MNNRSGSQNDLSQCCTSLVLALDHRLWKQPSKDVEKFTITLTDVKEIYQMLCSAKSDKVDIVHVGCPHLTYYEIRQIARLIEGKKVNENVYFWVQTDTPSYYLAHHHGEAQVIEKAGGKIFPSTCFGLLPLRDWGRPQYRHEQLQTNQAFRRPRPRVDIRCYGGPN
jgi:predicted aconitase